MHIDDAMPHSCWKLTSFAMGNESRHRSFLSSDTCIEDAQRGLDLQASKQAKNQKKSPAATAKDRLTESVLNKQTEVRLLSCLKCSMETKPSCRPACGS